MAEITINNITYIVIQNNGQRTSQPFPPLPDTFCPTGIELYVSNIPFEMYEDELLPLFASVGDIRMFRLMMNFSGTNRGFAYLTYADRAASELALQLFDRCPVGPPGPRHRLHVQISANRCSLLMGNMHKDLHADDIYAMLQQLTQGQGVKSIGVFELGSFKHAILNFHTHREAAMGRRMIEQDLSTFGRSCWISWDQ